MHKTTSEAIVRTLLHNFDPLPDREGLRETPKRYTRFLSEFLEPASFALTTFGGDGYDEMIVQTQITFYSICEHHLVPFFGHGAIAYIPGEKIVGLS
ncbi:MAG TPA: GTP cyclohydrolase I, partial [Candidatus Saccharimonadales bacterium]|nr:GTP cyclohydrolase I [Candidatus Saccharimonadales bacterium]